MKPVLLLLALSAIAYGEHLPSNEYIPPAQDIGGAHIEVSAPSNEYIAPGVEGQTVLANDGYRYKTVRRLRSRVRRDVSELPSSEYLPPNSGAHIEVSAPSNEYIAPAAETHTVLADDGYRYKTIRRFRSRVRREVNSEYLPPHSDAHIEVAPSNEYIAPAAEGQTVLADDGYRYKTIRRLRSRVRRDVSELPSAEYLPPNSDAHIEVSAPSNEYIAPGVEGQTVLANDGYRYKTIRRLHSRVRREVSAEYLPPSSDAHIEIAAPSNEYIAPAAEAHTVLADDGYRYKTIRRLRSRVRRDVSELPSAEYLPPNSDAHIEVSAPSNEYIAPAVEGQTILANDGYRYKTIRRLRSRVRREVSAEYLPPSSDAHIEIAAPSNEYIAPAAETHTVLADDGYRYKTIRRLRSRVRRDVSELPSSEYLPPSSDAHFEVSAPSNEYIAPAAEEHTVLANDGYRYKTVKKFKFRRH